MRRLPRSFRILVPLLLLAVLASACAATPSVTVTREPTAAELAAVAEADRTFAATPAYLARVKARATQIDSVRFEVFTSMESPLFDMGSRTEPLLTGAQSGNRSRFAFDMSPMMGSGAAMAGLNTNALTMTTVVDGPVTYLNAPFFREFMSLGGVSPSEFPWVQDIAVGWGRIDASSDGSNMFAEMGMNSGAGPDEMLELLESVGEVLDGGLGEVRGVPVHVAYAQVSIVDVLEQSGQDLGAIGIGDNELDALRQLFANIAVHIDDDGMVRRLEYTMDFSGITSVDPQATQLDLTMWQRVDFFEYGTDVEIAIPVRWIDITEDFEDLLDELN
jgi:hypothetical protein